MPTFFVDSSALVKLYRNELGSRWVSSLIDGSEHLIIARLAKMLAGSLLRRGRMPT